MNEVEIQLEVCHLTIFLNCFISWEFMMWISAGRTVRQPADVNDRGHFFWCLQRPNLCNYGDSTQRRREKWNEVVSQHCGGCLSGKARFDPQDFSPSELFIQARNNSSGISLRCPDADPHLIFALLLFHLVSDLIFCTFNILLLYSLKQNEEEVEDLFHKTAVFL